MNKEQITRIQAHPIFICGHPKSGTTLVQRILDSHPQLIVCPEESYFFRIFLPATLDAGFEEKSRSAERLLIHMFNGDQGTSQNLQKDVPECVNLENLLLKIRDKMYEYLFEEKNPRSADFLSSAVLAFGNVSGQLSADSKYWVEKTPYNELYIKKMFTFWPHAKCIHIIRDPRDNYFSYHRKHPEWSPEFFSENWNRFAKLGLANQRNLGADRYLIIRYEDLVTEPEKTINSMIDFLSIDFHESLLKPTRVGKSWLGNSMFDDKFQEISDDPVGRWCDRLSTLEANIIMVKSEKVMKQFNYDCTYSLDVKTKIRLVTWPVRKRLEFLVRKLSYWIVL